MSGLGAEVFVIQDLMPKERDFNCRSMLALLKTDDGWDLFALEDEPNAFPPRLIVGHYHLPPEKITVRCLRAGAARRRFRKKSCQYSECIEDETNAVRLYREMVSGEIKSIETGQVEIGCYSLETDWAGVVISTEMEITDNCRVYVTECNGDIVLSRTATDAFLAHCSFEDRNLVL